MNMQQNNESGNTGHELWITSRQGYGRKNRPWNVQEIRDVQPKENNDSELVDACEALGCDDKNGHVPEEVMLAKSFTKGAFGNTYDIKSAKDQTLEPNSDLEKSIRFTEA